MLGQYQKADPSLDKNKVIISQVPPFKPYQQYPHELQADHSIDWGNNSSNRPNWLYGTYCQGHFIVSFDGLQLADCQCIPMCLSAIIYSKLYPNHPHREWNKGDIYRILNQGNKLYAQHLESATPVQREKLQKENYFLTRSSILPESNIFGRKFKVDCKDILYGYILRGNRKSGGLDIDLTELFNQPSKYGILIAKQSCRAIWAADGKFYIFDPHANPPHKTAVIIENDSVEDLFKDLKYLLNSKDEDLVKMHYDLIPIVVKGDIFKGLPENDADAIRSLDKPLLELKKFKGPQNNAKENVDLKSLQAESVHNRSQKSQPVTVPIDQTNSSQTTGSEDVSEFNKTALTLQHIQMAGNYLQNESVPDKELREEPEVDKCKTLLNDPDLLTTCRFIGCFFPPKNEREMLQHVLKEHFKHQKLTVDQAKEFIVYPDLNDQFDDNKLSMKRFPNNFNGSVAKTNNARFHLCDKKKPLVTQEKIKNVLNLTKSKIFSTVDHHIENTFTESRLPVKKESSMQTEFQVTRRKSDESPTETSTKKCKSSSRAQPPVAGNASKQVANTSTVKAHS